MKAITLWQPWASWIMWGWKTIETRTHNRFHCLAGQTIAIHAAKRFDRNAIELARNYLRDEQIARCVDAENFPLGAILGTAHVRLTTYCLPEDSAHALIECDSERLGLFLGIVTPFDKPIPYKGRQGIFEVQL